jgi:hypothetical protein
MIWIILTIIAMLAIQYACVVLCLVWDDFKSKKVFKFSLIPGCYYLVVIKEIYNSIKDNYKRIPEE